MAELLSPKTIRSPALLASVQRRPQRETVATTAAAAREATNSNVVLQRQTNDEQKAFLLSESFWISYSIHFKLLR
jgi:hypothetical protein